MKVSTLYFVLMILLLGKLRGVDLPFIWIVLF